MDVYCFDEDEKDFARYVRYATPAERDQRRERCLFNHREKDSKKGRNVDLIMHQKDTEEDRIFVSPSS